ncbi:MAG: IPT/TIG domain-containing protein [Patescibacteria group bacterium]|nr:IPT/TIG domain-containing protein [Patescibacteria group bacterium]
MKRHRTIFRNLSSFLLTTAVLAVVMAFGFPAVAAVAPDLGLSQVGQASGLTTASLTTIIGNIIRTIIGLLGIVAVVLVIYAGFLWMTARGDDEQVLRAKKLLTQAVIGLVIIMASFAITTFILNAILEGTGGGGYEGCPPGQTCSSGGGGFDGGGGNLFRVSGTTPIGTLPNSSEGWPKNYAIRVVFNANVDPASVTVDTFVVRRCNERPNENEPFSAQACDTIVSGTRSVSGNAVEFKPSATPLVNPGDDPTYFEGRRWYYVQVKGGVTGLGGNEVTPTAIRDLPETPGVQPRSLYCTNPATILPNPPNMWDNTPLAATLCDRAMAFSDKVDTEAPVGWINAPKSPPGVCLERTRVSAGVSDDFLAARVDFRLEFPPGETGHTSDEIDALQLALVDSDSQRLTTVNNVNSTDSFTVEDLYVNLAALEPNRDYILKGTPYDGVPRAGETVEALFHVNPGHCCNGIQDGNATVAPFETGVDCGHDSQCGGCPGDECTQDSDCTTFCVGGHCADVPVITSVSPESGAAGQIVDIFGLNFGTNPGQVIFKQDKAAQPCDPKSWTNEHVAVVVPEGIEATSYVKLVRKDGVAYDADPAGQPTNGRYKNPFLKISQKKPGICYIEPMMGPVGADFSVYGDLLGDNSDSRSKLMLGGYEASTKAWDPSGKRIDAVVPGLADGVYVVKADVCDPQPPFACEKTANDPRFGVVPAAGQEKPVITEILPAASPVSSYITIVGSGFGAKPGKIIFTSTSHPEDYAFGEPPPDPPCAVTWRNNYVVIKTPAAYTCEGGNCPAFRLENYQVKVRTQAGLNSNEKTLAMNGNPPSPGICSIDPDNGPPGTLLAIRGEGFGERGEQSPPVYAVNFYVDQSHTMSAVGNYSWSSDTITPAVPGSQSDKGSWPKSGPVRVVANNAPSANTLPFKVQDCNEAGGTPYCRQSNSAAVCCPLGYCEAPTLERPACQPVAVGSAFAWHFSTGVLPDLPKVVRCPSCGQEPPCETQSPSPAANSSNACVNAQLRVKFTQPMDAASFRLTGTEPTVRVEELACGTDGTNCTPMSVSGQFALGVTVGGLVMTLDPLPAYNQGLLKKATRYRVTLFSNKTTGVGVRNAPALNGRLLDGDYDGTEGGDFQYTFATADSSEPCELSRVMVESSRYTIDHIGEPASIPLAPNAPGTSSVGFAAGFLAANCNSLPCRPVQPYDMAWSTSDAQILALLQNQNACFQPVTAAKETPTGQPASLTVRVHPQTSAATYYKEGASLITVKFADPAVVSYAPNCLEACPNAAVAATFNVPMDSASLSASTFIIAKCRNETCNPPYDADHAPTITSFTTNGTTAGFTNVVAQLAQPMENGAYYVVRLKGAPLTEADGTYLRSMSGVALKGLTSGAYFTWKFRVKDTPSICQADRTTLDPKATQLRYVGERAGFSVAAFGEPDACSASGQQLDSRQDWQWSFTETKNVIAGFLPDGTRNARVRTAAPAVGCTPACLNAGSQNVLAQCGNGRLEKGEDCEKSVSGAWPNGCDQKTCLKLGTVAPTCGNGVLDAGETCEKYGGVFPPGCKDPAVDAANRPDLNNRGCVLLGATAGGATCGDGVIGDGESCDDGNNASGDGCGADCLNEGTAPSCSDPALMPGAPCVNYCGNGITEPGEDNGCDLGVGQVAIFCDQSTCLKKGTSPCAVIGDPNYHNCCGNGVPENGEKCEAVGGELPPWCTSRCLLAGASFRYPNPSFCGDGAAGDGEDARCETTANRPYADPFQIIVGGRPQGVVSASDSLSATLTGVPPASAGQATVTMSCVCRSPQIAQTGDSQQYCDGQTVTPTNDLGCDAGGCCAPTPQVSETYPTDNRDKVCRNTVVRMTFDREIKKESVNKGIVVAENVSGSTCSSICEDNPNVSCTPGANGLDEGKCGTGGRCLTRVPLAFDWSSPDQAPTGRPSLLRGAWNAIKSFFRSLVPGVAAANPPANAVYCPIPGQVMVNGSVVTFYPKVALKPNAWYRVKAVGYDYLATDTPGQRTAKAEQAVTGSDGVPMPTSFQTHFRTKADICEIDYVTVAPGSHLFTTAENLGDAPDPKDKVDGDELFAARAHPHGETDEAEIASTPEYSFFWEWQQVTPDSVIEITPTYLPPAAGNGVCEYMPACSNDPTRRCPASCGAGVCGVAEDPNSADCRDAKPAQCGDGYCSVGEVTSCADDCSFPSSQTNQAWVNVRRQAPAGSSDVYPKNGQDIVTVKANVYKRLPDKVDRLSFSDSASVTVMLCEEPWPRRRTCDSDGKISLPWDRQANGDYNRQDCLPNEFVWFPFYDPDTNLSFYYCRDGQKAGAETETLPALNEERLIRIAPTRPDIYREYLFTYDLTGVSPDAEWAKNAIGLRIMTNPKHMSVSDWYLSQGFTGAPTPTSVDGYEAVREGRTVYANAAAKTATKIFTNVNILSYSEGSTPETVAVFNRILANMDFNRNVRDIGYCIDENGQQTLDATSRAISCRTDRECRVDAAGGFVDGRAGNICLADKSKMRRDLQRWSDLLNFRSTLVALKGQAYPRLEAGTYLRGRTVSGWPSWTEVLAKDLGMDRLPIDPLNSYMNCRLSYGGQYDLNTCWDATNKVYLCPAGSHIYEYVSAGGTNFSLNADFELLTTERCLPIGDANSCNNDQNGFCSWNTYWCGPNPNLTWGGGTCLEKTDLAACGGTPGCAWNNATGTCQYADGGILNLYGVNTTVANCSDIEMGRGGVCGDGVVQRQLGECGGSEGSCSPAGTCAWDAGRGVCTNMEMCEPNSLPDIDNECRVFAVCDKQRTKSCTDDNSCKVGDTNVGPCKPLRQIDSLLYPNEDSFRVGVRERTCTPQCAWGGFGACQAGICGDGRVQYPEACDDGSLNGTYGHCDAHCLGTGRTSCGDGVKQPNEACDCGDNNGVYSLNGVLQSFGGQCGGGGANANSCSWDCTGVGPRCGDGVKNGSEQCDGETEEYAKRCVNTTDAGDIQDGCTEDSQCPNGYKCGASCDSAKPERKWRRVCGANDPATTADDGAACQWGNWSCTAPGQCGNGVKETGEQCDDGNDNNRDACVIDPLKNPPYMCREAVCGDGYVSITKGEQCDDGAKNGQRCEAPYGLSCNHCSTACKLVTVSGGYCGDSIVQDAAFRPPGLEQCEPGQPQYLVNWTCVSTTAYDQAYGRIVGDAVCSGKNCQRSCPMPNTSLCKNEGSDFDDDGITDACDPDDDNDGVPDALDCAPLDKTVHGAYSAQQVDDSGNPTGTPRVVSAVTEVCDGKDNDCNYKVDDNWSVLADSNTPTSEKITLAGTVMDAVYSFQKISGATVRVQPMICDGDRMPCESNDECTSRGGGSKCGAGGEFATTDGNGRFSFAQQIRRPNTSNNRCKTIVQVDEFKPGWDIPSKYSIYLALTDRHTRGYFSHDFTPDIVSEPGQSAFDVNVFLMPKPPANHMMVALVWDGNLNGDYLDSHLLVPPDSTYGEIFFAGKQGKLDADPYAYLSCYHENGTEDCNDFSTAPEIMIWNWSGQPHPNDTIWKFYVDDYNCGATCGRNKFAAMNAKVYATWCNSDTDCALSGPYLPPTNNGKYWDVWHHIMKTSGPHQVSAPNTISDTKPTP